MDIAIPANDDAYRSVHVILSKLIDAVKNGRRKHDVSRGAAKKTGGAPAAEAGAQASAAEEAAPAAEAAPAEAGQ